MKFKAQLFVLLLCLSGPAGLAAVPITWTGSSSPNWTDSGNWDMGLVPGVFDTAIFSGMPLNNPILNAVGNVQAVVLDPTFLGTLTVGGSNTLTCGSFSISAGNFVGSTGSLNITGDFVQTGGDFTAPSGSLFLGGNFTFSGGTYNHNFGSLRLNGSTSAVFAPGSAGIYHLEIAASGTVTLVGTIKVEGNWTGTSGTVNPGTSSVVLIGASQVLSGNNSFFNLSHPAPAPATLALGPGTLSVSGNLDLQGQPGGLLTLVSNVGGSSRTLNATGTSSLAYLSVKDMVAVPGLTASASTDGGGNSGWIFIAAPTPTQTPIITPICNQYGKFGSDGGATQFSGSLNGQQVVVPVGGLLNHVFVTANSVTQGSPLKLGIYTDAGNYPGTLVTELPEMFEHASGLNAYPGTGVYIPAGTYWVVAGANGSYTVWNNWETTFATQRSFTYSGTLPATYPGGASVYTTFHWKLGIDLCNVPVSPTPTRTPTATHSPSPSISPTPTISPTFSISNTFSVSPTSTETPTVTETLTITQTSTISPTHSITPTFSVTPPYLSVLVDFESGSAGWSGTGLWHATDTNSANPYQSANSPTKAWWYGRDDTGTFNTGATNSGYLTSPVYPIPADAISPELRFASFYQTEDTGTTYDRKTVEFSVNGGAWNTLLQVSGSPVLAWTQKVQSLTAYRGSNLQFRFYFNSVDVSGNDYRGWMIDDFQLIAQVPPTATVSPTPLPGPLSPAFGFTSYGGGSYSSLKSASEKAVARFPQRGNKSLDEFSIYVLGITGSPPQYRYALYPDDHGQPGAVPLYSLVSAVSTGWNSFPITPQPLVDGEVYYVVVEPDTTPPDSSNYIDVMFQYGQRVWTIDQVADDILAGGTGNGGGWSFASGPVLGLHYSDSSRDGGSFQTFSGNSIYGSNRAGQRFKAPAGGAWVGSLGLQFQKTGAPADDLYYSIYNVTQASTAASGVLSTAAAAPGGHAWMDADLGVAVFLNASDDYRIELSSPGSTAGNGYNVLAAFTGGGPISLHAYTYGGAAYAMESSTNGGVSYNADGGQDLFFRFNFGKVAAPTATATRTAQTTATSTATLTATPTATPSATPCGLTVNGSSLTLTAGTYSYCNVLVTGGGTLFIQGAVTLDVTSFQVDAGSQVIGDGRGFAGGAISASGSGPGGGAGGASQGGGGGGHAGFGGGGASATVPLGGGPAYDVPAAPLLAGSGGGGALTTAGAPGGAALFVSATGSVTLNGTISMNGAGLGQIAGGGASSQGGGGSGGSVYIQALNLGGSGAMISVDGGDGGGFSSCGGLCYGGGGGSGGIINLCVSGTNTLSTGLQLFGGSGGSGTAASQGGAPGHYFLCAGNQISPTTTPTATPTLSTTPSQTPTASPSATVTASPTASATPLCVPADGEAADVVLGQPDFVTTTANLGGVSAATLNFPSAALVVGSKLLVADYGNNRVLIWNSIPSSVQAPADVVLGQVDFSNAAAGNAADKLNGPMGLASDGSKLVVSDYGNHRVLIYNSIPATNGASASVVLGQTAFGSGTVNMGGLSASSFNGPFGLLIAGGKLIVADSGNNRVKVYNSLPSINNATADVVIGQPSFTGASFATSATALHTPRGVASNGLDLQIADTANHRVLLYNSIPTINGAAADKVLGQSTFGTAAAGTSAQGLSQPFALLRLGNGLLVSDRNNNRLLRFDPLPTSNFASANGVIGQTDLVSGGAYQGLATAGPAGLNAPGQMAVSGTRLILPDFNSHRVLIFDCSFISTPTVTPTATATASPSETTTATPSASPSETTTHTPTATPTASPSVTPSPTPSASPSATPSVTGTATPSHSPSATGSATPSATSSATPTATPSLTGTQTPSATPSASPSATLTSTASATGSATPTVTLTASPSVSPSFTPTATPSATQSATLTVTRTASASATPSSTRSATPTVSESATPTLTRTATSSVTPPNTPTATPTATASNTPVPSLTASPTRSDTVSPTATRTPTSYLSQTPSFTITPTFTVSDTPLPTGTPDVPTVLDRNVWRPGTGQPLHIGIKAPMDGKVVVNIFNLASEKVRRPFEADVVAGITVDALWDGKNDAGEPCGAGVYVISVQGAGISSLKKVVLMK